MFKFKLAAVVILTAICFHAQLWAADKSDLQKYFNNMAVRVKTTADPVEKRSILNSSFQTMLKAIAVVKSSPSMSAKDKAGIEKLEATVQEKSDELNGRSGFASVQNKDLNAFADYTVQDMEQADQYVTISLTALLLAVIILLLI